MLNPKLIGCTECASIDTLIKEIDCLLALEGKKMYNNISFMLNYPIPAGMILDLLNYRRILQYKYVNSDYISCFTVAMIANKVKRHTAGVKCNVCDCNHSVPPVQGEMYVTTTTTTTSLSTTTTTTSTTTTTTTDFPCGDPGEWLPYGEGCYYRVEVTQSIAPTSPIGLETAIPNANYSISGTRFYFPNYNIDGTGLATSVLTNDVWRNNTGGNGPMLRSAIWTDLPYSGGSAQPLNQWIGFVACVEGVVESKTYYVGIAGDNEYKLMIDGELIVNSYIYNLPIDDDHHKYWHVYPIYLYAGSHQIHVFGLNRGQQAAFACVIYDNSLLELVNAVTVNDLNIIFDTIDQDEVKIVQTAGGIPLNTGYICETGDLDCDDLCKEIIICCDGPSTTTTTTTVLLP